MFSEWCLRHLYPYQQRWLKNRQQQRICVKARQTGFSFIISVEAVLHCCFDRTNQLIVSASQRQATEVLEKCKKVNQLFTLFPASSLPPAVVLQENKTELTFSNGARIISLPQNPRTIRGFTGNVYLDEFAHHKDDAAIYQAVAPAVTRGYRLTIVSTPYGQSGTFYELWSDIMRYPDFARFTIDVFDAQRDGLKIDVGQLRKMYDEESFRQEYCCEFVDEATAFFPYELIQSCVGVHPENGKGLRFIGVDIGRKSDATIVIVLEMMGDKLYTLRMEELKNLTFETQRVVIRQLIRELGISRGCIDATGIGMQLSEELEREFGFIEPVHFTAEAKERMAVSTKRKFENKEIQIPNNIDLIADIHQIRKKVTPASGLKFDAARSSRGHSDRFWALALAIRAAEGRGEVGVRWM
jgi:phage FluMu gp28-like protein